MTQENGLALLARRDALTEADWYAMVNTRVSMLKPHLRDMTLKSIGDIQLSTPRGSLHSLKMDNPKQYGKFSLSTRGIFQRENSFRSIPSNREILHHRLWCLTREVEWLTIEVGSIYVDEITRLEAFLKFENIQIETSNLKKVCHFCKCTPEKIWSDLGEAVKEWAGHRKALYEDARRLEEDVLHEEAVLAFVPR